MLLEGEAAPSRRHVRHQGRRHSQACPQGGSKLHRFVARRRGQIRPIDPPQRQRQQDASHPELGLDVAVLPLDRAQLRGEHERCGAAIPNRPNLGELHITAGRPQPPLPTGLAEHSLDTQLAREPRRIDSVRGDLALCQCEHHLVGAQVEILSQDQYGHGSSGAKSLRQSSLDGPSSPSVLVVVGAVGAAATTETNGVPLSWRTASCRSWSYR